MTGIFMRKTLLTIAVVLTSGTAMASSIEVIGQNRTGNGSLLSISCDGCPPPKPRQPAPQPTPVLSPGTQDISIRDVGGKREIVRTEAWLGGSPVTYVSSNPTWFPAPEMNVAAPAPDTVDMTAKTSAVGKTIGGEMPEPVTADAVTPLSLDGFTLRQ